MSAASLGPGIFANGDKKSRSMTSPTSPAIEMAAIRLRIVEAEV